jgi:S-adenosylmethionine hydrolase
MEDISDLAQRYNWAVDKIRKSEKKESEYRMRLNDKYVNAILDIAQYMRHRLRVRIGHDLEIEFEDKNFTVYENIGYASYVRTDGKDKLWQCDSVEEIEGAIRLELLKSLAKIEK